MDINLFHIFISYIWLSSDEKKPANIAGNEVVYVEQVAPLVIIFLKVVPVN
ncbi:hypothetical protein JCM19231_206 [Vibrio ishigakensis]|uniref:Uncharacterized protein n=1 Tax=Vibrio ishigakensis TaxID=1481914 RepID=A0A0B8NTV5_9VIBR|nr:hypothetical protein JCM19231_206 [Vibrio ishigakensis]